MAYKIAICDDDQILCKTVIDFLTLHSETNRLSLIIKSFFTGEDLVKALSTGSSFDLIILDIQLEETSGIEVGKYIREVIGDNITQLLYISSSGKYSMELFASRPLNFIIKPISMTTLKSEVDKAISLLYGVSNTFNFQSERVFYKIPYKEILYFKSNDKKITLHKANGEAYEFYGKLSNIVDELPHDFFYFIHKSYLVNYIHIISSDYETVTMSDNAVLPISQSNRKQIRLKLMRRWHDG